MAAVHQLRLLLPNAPRCLRLSATRICTRRARNALARRSVTRLRPHAASPVATAVSAVVVAPPPGNFI